MKYLFYSLVIAIVYAGIIYTDALADVVPRPANGFSYFFEVKGNKLGLFLDEGEAIVYASNNPKKFSRVYRCQLEEVRLEGRFIKP